MGGLLQDSFDLPKNEQNSNAPRYHQLALFLEEKRMVILLNPEYKGLDIVCCQVGFISINRKGY